MSAQPLICGCGSRIPHSHGGKPDDTTRSRAWLVSSLLQGSSSLGQSLVLACPSSGRTLLEPSAILAFFKLQCSQTTSAPARTTAGAANSEPRSDDLFPSRLPFVTAGQPPPKGRRRSRWYREKRVRHWVNLLFSVLSWLALGSPSSTPQLSTPPALSSAQLQLAHHCRRLVRELDCRLPSGWRGGRATLRSRMMCQLASYHSTRLTGISNTPNV